MPGAGRLAVHVLHCIGSPAPATEATMPLPIPGDAPTLLIRRTAFERAGLTRARLDERFNLTPDEFRVERDLIAIGPIHGEEITTIVDELEATGLVYFEDFFELTGNWPDWVTVFAGG